MQSPKETTYASLQGILFPRTEQRHRRTKQSYRFVGVLNPPYLPDWSLILWWNSLVLARCASCLPYFYEVVDYHVGGPGFEMNLPGSSGYPGEVSPLILEIPTSSTMVTFPDTWKRISSEHIFTLVSNYLDYVVVQTLWLDQRGTGLSTPLSPETLQKTWKRTRRSLDTWRISGQTALVRSRYELCVAISWPAAVQWKTEVIRKELLGSKESPEDRK